MAKSNAASLLVDKPTDEANENDNSPAAAEFFSKLLEAVTVGHILHLQAKGDGSFAKHLALGDFYTGIQDIADSVIEQFQGCYGLVTYKLPPFKEPKDALSFVVDLYEYIEANRYKVCDETHIQNTIDEACSLISRTRYKLRFLR